MKAMLLKKYGENSKFEPGQVEKPSLDENQVLIKISASSVNTVDTMIKNMGEDLPFSPEPPAILGMDFAGTVESVGKNVSNFSIGDEVYGCAGGLGDLQGTLAEYIAADSRLIAHKPKNITMREAAAIPLVGITAYEGLTRANVQKGNSVLVHGGAGGVGHLAVQLARHFGAKVSATGSGEKQMKIIQGYGATSIDYTTEDVESYVKKHTDGNGFDVVFDTVGGENLKNSFEAAALNAQISTTVSLLELDLSPVHFKGLTLHVVFMLIPMIHNFKRENHGKILSELTKIIEAGAVKPLLDEQKFSMEEVGEAYAHLTSGKATGKVVVEN
ncbi:zinc-dependent alcohol dehydrogenase family protein [Gramella sp. MAR_2010_147]|uniref:zinc-dependent alcohol dehydrogenase family protein n=1 Tax=Gramella sp. MAR_2010_147 TaxID=1250205 RepID=UPI00087A0E9B|nr:zinc-dependent alcohol dehydrogenase family protein [Gramella sp. MAR_2010_147]SDR92008.1 NADPH:quinone reductase [Gramella sp. MAR_2010_147]